MIGSIITGALAGLGYGLLGFGKNKRKKGNEFSLVKTIKPIVICAIVGGIAAYVGMDLSSMGVVMTSSIGISVTKVIDLLWGILFK